MVIHAAKRASEHLIRNEDSKIGRVQVQDSALTNTDRAGSLGSILLLDSIKRLAAMDELTSTVANEDHDGNTCKVIAFSFKGGPHPYQKFWVDLKRGGHTVRRESYSASGSLSSRTEIELRQFPIGDDRVWMPVSGITRGYASRRDGKPYFAAEPTTVETIHINAGTLEFNRRPGPLEFKIRAKAGTPVSDSLKKMTYEFGTIKPSRPVSRSGAEAMLKGRLAEAEAQRSELVAVSPSWGLDWWFWITLGLAALVSGSSLALWVQRRRH